jgi:hypothetical protein
MMTGACYEVDAPAAALKRRGTILVPSAGLSLVGFLDQARAIEHFKTVCVAADESEAAFVAEWTAAQQRLGPPIPNAGYPDIRPMPEDLQSHAYNLKQQAWVAAILPQIAQASIQLIEIDPLLSFQLTLNIAHADRPFQALSSPPSPLELSQICLPINQPAPEFAASRVEPDSQSVIIKSQSLDLQFKQVGLFEMNMGGLNVHVGGAKFHRGLPLVHVVRFDGRCYMYNGFHRAIGARRRGATHVPCVFRDVQTAEQVGLRPDMVRLQRDVLESSNPPTLAHFTQGRAYPVQLRRRSRILHVTWSQYIVADE